MKRALVVSNDEVGAQMAGPGIRYYHFARELSRSFDVTLVVPRLPNERLGELEVVEAGSIGRRGFRELATRFDVVVAQTLSARTMTKLAHADVRVVYDLYDPFLIANLGFHADGDVAPRYRTTSFWAPTLLQQIALANGDGFVCASERQRDLWIGMLGALGRIDPSSVDADPSLRDLIDVVPFGLESEPPVVSAPALKGVVPGIGPDDRVLLWGGGIWNWFDPLTPIRAVHELSKRREDVKLYFLGVKHPNPGMPQMAMAARALELAQELGAYERSVFFNFGWVPYADRANYLLDSDVGITSHFDTLEARFSFRTRVLDYFWAGLPTIGTEGDVLADLVRERNLGRTVGVGDAGAWAAAIEELVDDRDERARIEANVAATRSELTWPRVSEPLARLAALERSPARAPRRAAAATTYRYFAIALENVLRRYGVAGGAREVSRILRKPPVP